jgi:hypothetical protein
MAKQDDVAVALRTQVNRSGLVFQTAVERKIRDTLQHHEWQVLSSEHAWRDEAGNTGYIDLVLARQNVRLVIECKKRDAKSWVFLCPREDAERSTYDVKMLFALAVHRRTVTANAPHNMRLEMDWEDRGVITPSPQARFCVRDKDEPLDTTARTLLLATEALAAQELELRAHQNQRDLLYYIPMIVTNARLSICYFDARTVDLATGLLTGQEEFTNALLVRFRKSFLTREPEALIGTDLGDLNTERERTVLIASPAHIEQLLAGFMLRGGPPGWSNVHRIIHEEEG